MHAFVIVAGRFGSAFGSAASDCSLRTLHGSRSCCLLFDCVPNVTHRNGELNSSLNSSSRQLDDCTGLQPRLMPATSSHSFAGELQPASYRSAGLTHTTQKDLAVVEHGMIWTGVTQMQALSQHKHANDILQCVLIGCMHGCIIQCCPGCGM